MSAMGLVERLRNGGQTDLADMAEGLVKAATAARSHLDAGIRMEQPSFDHPPEPVSEWDYNACFVVHELDAALAAAGGAK